MSKNTNKELKFRESCYTHRGNPHEHLAGEAQRSIWGFPKLGYLFEGLSKKDCSILGSILGFPLFGEYHNMNFSSDCCQSKTSGGGGGQTIIKQIPIAAGARMLALALDPKPEFRKMQCSAANAWTF